MGSVVHSRSPAHLAGNSLRKHTLLAGYTFARNVVDEPSSRRSNRGHPARKSGRRNQPKWIQTARRNKLLIRLIRGDPTRASRSRAGLHRVPEKLLKAVGVDGIEISGTEPTEALSLHGRDAQFPKSPARSFLPKRARRRGLNRGTVGQRVGKRDSQLQDVSARGFQRVGNIQSSSARRVASRHVGSESLRLRGGKICKASGNSSIHSTQAQSSAPPKVASQSLQEEASRSHRLESS